MAAFSWIDLVISDRKGESYMQSLEAPQHQPGSSPLPSETPRKSRLTRRAFVAATSALTGVLAAAGLPAARARAGHAPSRPTSKRPPPSDDLVSYEEAYLAFRCHGFHLEGLSYPITPLGMHYLLMHFDIPRLEQVSPYQVAILGHVRKPMVLTLDQLKTRPTVTQPMLLECAGNGRAFLHPRPIYVPWFNEAIGVYEYTGIPLRPLLEEAGVLDGAVDVVFTGWDQGVDLGVHHAFERAMPIEEALRDGNLLAWNANGQSLLPQHGWPLRFVANGWYGMQSVKWLKAITVLNEKFTGVENQKVYRITDSADEPGTPVTRQSVRALVQPPGFPDLFTRHRFLSPGTHVLNGMAWSGWGAIARVELSVDGGGIWADAELLKPVSPYAWTPFRFTWQGVGSGDYELVPRATDSAGNIQPLEPFWNYQGMAQNGVQRVPVTVV